jgi:hypothetical protein
VFLPTACVDPLYGHRRYNPVYDAAEETGLPVFLHSVTAVHPAFPFNIHGFETIFSAHVLAHPISSERAAMPRHGERDARRHR